MHAAILLQTLTEKSCPSVHKKRSDCLFDVVTALIDSGQLWISALGRTIRNKTTAKHNIKKVDTLVGNEKLHRDRKSYYTYMATTLIGSKKRPLIIVDWSPVQGDCAHNFLRASVTGNGRSLTLYEEVHELKDYANNKVHKNFLNNLAEVIPADCQPIVITDAGFRNPWFRLILDLGWDFVGRLRHNTKLKLEDNNDWHGATSLHSRATATAKYLGSAIVAKSNPLKMNLYIMLGKKKDRVKKTKLGKKSESTNSKKYAKSAKEPWVIVTSLPHRHGSPNKIMKVYKFRMQIEESFRDLKDKRYGFRLPESGTKNVKRLENLLLIALLATFAIWLAGQVAIKNKWHYQLQANTVRDKAVLSIAFIGIQVLRNLNRYKLSRAQLQEAVGSLQELVKCWEDI